MTIGQSHLRTPETPAAGTIDDSAARDAQHSFFPHRLTTVRSPQRAVGRAGDSQEACTVPRWHSAGMLFELPERNVAEWSRSPSRPLEHATGFDFGYPPLRWISKSPDNEAEGTMGYAPIGTEGWRPPHASSVRCVAGGDFMPSSDRPVWSSVPTRPRGLSSRCCSASNLLCHTLSPCGVAGSGCFRASACTHGSALSFEVRDCPHCSDHFHRDSALDVLVCGVTRTTSN